MDLVQAIKSFIAGGDVSIDAANVIELGISDSYSDDQFMQETAEMLAMYRPLGGDFLFDTAIITNRLKTTLEYLQAH